MHLDTRHSLKDLRPTHGRSPRLLTKILLRRHPSGAVSSSPRSLVLPPFAPACLPWKRPSPVLIAVESEARGRAGGEHPKHMCLRKGTFTVTGLGHCCGLVTVSILFYLDVRHGIKLFTRMLVRSVPGVSPLAWMMILSGSPRRAAPWGECLNSLGRSLTLLRAVSPFGCI